MAARTSKQIPTCVSMAGKDVTVSHDEKILVDLSSTNVHDPSSSSDRYSLRGNILQVADSRLGAFPPSDANSESYGEFDSQEASIIVITKDMHDFDPSAAMEDEKMITNLLHLGLLCCNPNPEDRPSMRLVSQLLQSSENMEMSMPPLPGCKPQANYSRPGFSQLARIPSSSTLSSVHNVQDAGHASAHSTPSPSCFV